MVYQRLYSYLKPYRKQFIWALIAMVIYGMTDGVVPFLIKRVLDDIFGNQNKQMLYILPGVLVGFAIIRGTFGFIQHYLTATVGLRIVQDLRSEINQKLLKLSIGFFSEQRSGALISRMTNDTLLVRSALTDTASAFLRDSIRIVVLLCAALYLDPVLGFIAFIGFPIAIYPIIRYGKKVRRLSRVGQDLFGGLTSILHETITGHKIVLSYVREKFEQERFDLENKRVTETYLRSEKYAGLSAPTNEIVASLAIAAVIIYGGASVISGVRTQGDFVAFITSMFLLYDPFKKMGRANNIVQSAISASQRIFEILDLTPEIEDSPDAIDLSVKDPSVEYDNVSFRYKTIDIVDNDQAVDWGLDQISFKINAGQTLALVGMSGGGKSTIVNLLPRFYDIQSGMIRIGGVDIKTISLSTLRSSIALVSQDTFLFNESVSYNVAYGRLGASEAEIIQAARAANAHEFISRLPQGYNTVIGEHGLRLSGGERARIAIARALLKDAPILILDEATAALDSESEELVQKAIDRLTQGRTVLVIAHRLSTVRKAEKIVVVVHGKIIETGTHQELLDQNGEYAKLYKIQFKDQDQSELKKVVG